MSRISFTKLADTLVLVGLDQDILNDLLSEVEAVDTHFPSLVETRNFVANAVSVHSGWASNGVDDSLGNPIYPFSYMNKNWRPKEETIQLLLEELEYDRTEIGFVREYFKRSFLGEKSRTWDCDFIKYAISYCEMIASDENTFSSATNDKGVEISRELRLKNQQKLREMITEVLQGKTVSHLFNYTLSDSWQPASWVVNKLLKSNISKRFIYGDTILKPFRSHMKLYAKSNTNPDVEYFHWVLKRFRVTLRMLNEEKDRLQNELNRS